MHENFIALAEEKRDRILNAAMHEFSIRGFKNASTNEIVSNARISKGALFHYFSSKKDLFDFLYRYSINFFVDAIKPRIKELPSDVFERWIAYAALKFEIAAQYPDMSAFMQNAYRDDSQETGSILKDEYDKISMTFQKVIHDGIDFSKFRADVDTAKALQIIWWVLEGFAFDKLKQLPNTSIIKNTDYLRILTREMKGYLDLLRKSFYKEEFWSHN